MSMHDFFIVFATCLVTMLLCRCLPLFVLKGRQLPEGLARALGFIPPAAFAAPCGQRPALARHVRRGRVAAAMPLVAAAVVVVVARKTKSLLWCALAGCASYALLAFCFAPAQCKAGQSRFAGWRLFPSVALSLFRKGFSLRKGVPGFCRACTVELDGKIEAFG